MQNQSLTTRQKFAVTLWLTLVACGLIGMNSYSMTPGRSEFSAQHKSPTVSPGHLQLLVFIHPKCPCTAATIHELSGVVSSVKTRIAITAYLYTPPTAPSDWLNTANERALKKMEGVRIVSDINATEAQRFHVNTSGHLMLFDSHGNLRFSGGITAGRGHEGDNPALSAFRDAVQHASDDHSHKPLSPSFSTAPVFGCSLR